jgi:hypothetical protein
VGREDGRYRIGFVIRPEFAEDPLTAVQFGALAGRISREALDGVPVAADLLDEHLGAIRGIAPGGVLAYGPNELYYTEPVSVEEAGVLGEWLVETGFFGEDRGASVLLGREDAAFRLQFVVDPPLADDPEVRAAFLEVGRLVAAGPLGGHPLEVHLCDGRFRTLFRERPAATPER